MILLLLLFSSGLAFRPRGVRQEVASLYNPATDYRCFDGSATVPFIRVNDNYCDCEDGSDEPGTSACPRGSFYCENIGHKGLVLPSSRVGDGLCDCCDGTDEWETQANCSNICDELGREAREASQAAARTAIEGHKIRAGMIEEARRVEQEKGQEIATLEAKRIELEAIKGVKEAEKDVAEAPEKEALEFYRKVEEEEKNKKEEEEKVERAQEAASYFDALDTNSDGKVDLEELRARPGLDTNKDGEVSEEEAKFFLSDQESFDLESFQLTGFVLLKPYLDLEADQAIDEAVDEVVEEQSEKKDEEDKEATEEVAWHPMATPEPSVEAEEKEEDSYNEAEDEDYDINDQDDEDDDDDDQELDEVPKYKPEEEERKEEEIESKYDAATKALVDTAEVARKAFNDAEKEVKDTERDLKKLQDEMGKDYGDEGVFRVLAGQCFELEDNEYKYKICPFDHCSQRPKNGGSETRLGSWGSWEGGAQGEKYTIMKYTGGQGCWNAPARSTAVHLYCGVEDKVIWVTEPNRCEYEMGFTTPAVCQKLAPTEGHDEL